MGKLAGRHHKKRMPISLGFRGVNDLSQLYMTEFVEGNCRRLFDDIQTKLETLGNHVISAVFVYWTPSFLSYHPL